MADRGRLQPQRVVPHYYLVIFGLKLLKIEKNWTEGTRIRRASLRFATANDPEVTCALRLLDQRILGHPSVIGSGTCLLLE